MIEVAAKGPEEAITQSEAHINDFLFRGGTDTEAEDVGVGKKFGVGELVEAAWANAKANVEAAERAWLDHASSFLPEIQLLADKTEVAAKEVAETKPSRNQNLQQAAPVQPAWRRLLKAAAAPKPAPRPENEEEKEAAVSAAAMEELKRTVAGIKSKPDFKITILSDGEKKERIAELAEIFQSDKTEERLRYNTRKAEVAEELEVQQMDVHRAVMHYLEKEKKEKRDLTQSQKVVVACLE